MLVPIALITLIILAAVILDTAALFPTTTLAAAAAASCLLIIAIPVLTSRSKTGPRRDYRRDGILRCGQCTRRDSDTGHKVVYNSHSEAQRAASHYHQRFKGALQEPYQADCGRWHLYTPR